MEQASEVTEYHFLDSCHTKNNAFLYQLYALDCWIGGLRGEKCFCCIDMIALQPLAIPNDQPVIVCPNLGTQ